MKKICTVFIIALFVSCSSDKKEKDTSNSYFDLLGYFTKEAERLAKEQPSIDKTVIINGKTEAQRVKITDWNTELQSFIANDINKASWRGEFKTQEANNSFIYTANNDKIPVKSVSIEMLNGKPTSIKIIAKNENTLYHSYDTLVYKPNSFYQIIKSQKIKLMEKKNYQIIGKFK